jgi:hypothetical protein
MYHWKAHWLLPLPGYGTCDTQVRCQHNEHM